MRPLKTESTSYFQHPELTRDEWLVLDKLVHGARPIQIAYDLNINVGWVRHRFTFLRQKYKCEDITSVKRLVQSKGMPREPEGDA
jgi:FixJ family two-component response regulator